MRNFDYSLSQWLRRNKNMVLYVARITYSILYDLIIKNIFFSYFQKKKKIVSASGLKLLIGLWWINNNGGPQNYIKVPTPPVTIQYFFNANSIMGLLFWAQQKSGVFLGPKNIQGQKAFKAHYFQVLFLGPLLREV